MSNFYSLRKILEEKCDYNIIIGERSNGKTYAALEKIISDYTEKKKEGAYIRRWREDVIGKRAEQVFSSLESNGIIKKYSGGKYDRVVFSRGKWHLATYDEKNRRMKADPKPFCYAFSLSDIEHDKSTSYPNVSNVVFDEFLTRRYYLPDEFVIFMNVLSTIIRERDDVQIFMLGNTVNKYCPYFGEMGLKNIETMRQGTIDVYNFGDNGLKVAVEYCAESKQGKRSNKYFAFDNPRLEMITSGKWELAIYPHLPAGYKIKPSDIIFTFYIKFSQIVACDVVCCDNGVFLYVRPQTKEISRDSLLYTLDYEPYVNIRRTFLKPIDGTDSRIRSLFDCNRVFYQSNELGEVVHNYLIACVK